LLLGLVDDEQRRRAGAGRGGAPLLASISSRLDKAF